MCTGNSWLSQCLEGALEFSGQEAGEAKRQQKRPTKDASSVPTENNLKEHFIVTALSSLLVLLSSTSCHKWTNRLHQRRT